MSSYKSERCPFTYRVSSVGRIIDGDTIDVAIDLGFDVCTKQRIRLMGIDTPESRTSDKIEKVFRINRSKHFHAFLPICTYTRRYKNIHTLPYYTLNQVF